MKQQHLSRAEFLQWVGSQAGEGSERLDPSSSAMMRPSDIALVWVSDDERDPPIIAVKASELREFTAFVTTYIGSFAPFTAFFRVVPMEMLDFLPVPGGAKDRESILPLLGGVIADAALSSRNRSGRLAEIGLTSCYATSSWVAAKGFVLGYSNSMVEVAVRRWGQIRETVRSAPTHATDRFWNIVLDAIDPEAGTQDNSNDELVTFVSEVRRSLNRGLDIDSRFIERLPVGVEIRGLTRLNREDRVRALDSIFSKLSNSGIPEIEIEALIGLVASLVGQGSFNSPMLKW